MKEIIHTLKKILGLRRNYSQLNISIKYLDIIVTIIFGKYYRKKESHAHE